MTIQSVSYESFVQREEEEGGWDGEGGGGMGERKRRGMGERRRREMGGSIREKNFFGGM